MEEIGYEDGFEPFEARVKIPNTAGAHVRNRTNAMLTVRTADRLELRTKGFRNSTIGSLRTHELPKGLLSGSIASQTVTQNSNIAQQIKNKFQLEQSNIPNKNLE